MITPIIKIEIQNSIWIVACRIKAIVYTITPVATERLIWKTKLIRRREEESKRFSRYSYTLTTPDLYKVGIRATIKKAIANGTPNSYVSHWSPPPSFNPTKAGAEIKLIADNCVAIVDKLSGNQPIFLPPRK